MRHRLRIGTRGSRLALWQARTVATRLAASGAPDCELVVIRTSGDRLSDANLSVEGGKRLFVQEIEDALLGGEVDVAVHSAKDVPAALPDGLTIAGVLPRADPRDALVLRQVEGPGILRNAGFAEPADADAVSALLGSDPVIGTSSVRRVAQLARAMRHLRFAPVRGNVDTRLRKLDEGQFGAIVLAVAGVERLGLSSRISAALPIDVCVPAPGQAIVAAQTRKDDAESRGWVDRISDAPSLQALTAERALVEALGGGCQLPIGALARWNGSAFELVACVVTRDGSCIVRASDTAPPDRVADLGSRVAGRLLSEGAGAILDAVRAHERPPAS